MSVKKVHDDQPKEFQFSTENIKKVEEILKRYPDKNKKISSIIIVTHKSINKSLIKILKEITKKNFIKRKPKLIRIDDN